MKCKEFKYFLLGCENPDQPPADVKAHLASCADCRDWQNRMALIEMNVPFLPVPASARRADLLRRILSQPATAKTRETGKVEESKSSLELPQSSIVADRRDAGRRGGILGFFRAMEPSARRFAVGGLAAAVLLVVLGYMVIHTPHRPVNSLVQGPPQAPDSLVANILKRDLRLADSDSAADRFLALADLAEDFGEEIKTLAPLPDAKEVLDDMVKKYEKVVNVGLMEVANDLAIGDRTKLLDQVGNRLHKTGREIDELGDQLNSKIPKASRDTLRRLTKVAHDGNKKLLDLREAARTPPQDAARPAGTAVVREEGP
jgi:hypothetical protein